MKIITIFAFFASLLPATIDVAACGAPQTMSEDSTLGERRRLNLDRLSRLGDNGNGGDVVTFNDTMVLNCTTLDYTVNLVILEHIYFFFQAGPDAQSNNGCQSILIHATSNNMTVAKEAFIVPTNSLADLNGEDDSTPHGIIDFGTYPLHDILTSYEDASPFGVGHEDESYHYIYNNCGDFLVKLPREPWTCF